jgi:HEAT repeat protein
VRNRFKVLISGMAVGGMLLAASIAPARILIDSGMTAIRQMVLAGRMEGAVRLLESDYDLKTPGGLHALRDFSLLVLRQGLKDPDSFERCYSATALAGHDEWSGRSIIVQALKSPNLLIQRAALEGLAQADNGEALQILEHFYRLSGPISQAIAIQAIAQVKTPAVMPLLLQATRDPNSSGAFWAVNGLGRMGDRDALPYLQKLLAKSIDPMMRTEAAHSMILLGDHTPIDTLEVGLASAESDVAAEAALALGDARDPAAVELLKETMASKRAAAEVRLAAAVALTHYGNSEGLPMLQRALDDERNRNNIYIISMLDHLDFVIGRPLIVDATRSASQEIRLTAYEIIGRAGGDPEVGLLGTALHQTGDPIERAQIAWSLARIARPASIPVLLEAIQDPTPEIRDTAAEGLAQIADKALQ